MKNNILCFGEVLWDAFGDEKVAGGAVMNVAYHLRQQGANASFASKVGMDASGFELIAFLKENNLYSELIQNDAELPTCEVTVQLDKNQQATYIIPQPVSWDNIKTETALTQSGMQASAIIFGSLACRQQTTRDTLLNLLNETNALKVFDVNLRAPHYTLSTIETLAARADVVKMNEDEANLLINGSNGNLKDKVNEFRKKYHAQTICVTRGEHGAIVWHDYEFYEHPGFTVDVVDTVGAGDSFLATFINGLLNKQPLQEVLEKSCAVGAYVAGKRGANPVYDEGIVEVLK
ncbi:carbohydrate kinase [Mucilaginibacter sp.]|uniref:carbohydrate kinase family protein n=1 Tax=Mucilaginibacter sp. TaxID=1882438 RepID=UPI00261F1079|nr:carbohydrate kinase [Mucilaginibacter sp.]